MPRPVRRERRPLSRADLPDVLTAETLRHLDFRTLRELAQPGNGVLDAEEQTTFDAALAELRHDTTSLIDESLRRAHRDAPGSSDPALLRSYERTRQRLAEQAERARSGFPQLPGDAPTAPPNAPPTAPPDGEDPPEPTSTEGAHDDVSPGTLEQEVEQTSDTLDLLERIASLQQQQLEHQESKLLSETRGFFFAFLVSVAVIIAGVAPLVDAEPHDRLLIVLWTVAATAVAGLAYAGVRAVQSRS